MADEAFFLGKNNALGEVLQSDELLHSVPTHLIGDSSVTETQYFGFCVPEQNIHAFCYLWHHPNLRTLTGGIAVYKGNKPTFTYGEICDFRTFMDDSAISNGIKNFRLDNGYGVETISPLKKHRVTYEDESRDSRVDVLFEGIIPPVMFGDGAHFEQPGRVTGEITMRGERHRVDCYSVRDRSWAKPRPETSMSLPAVSWMQAVFSDEFSFCCTVLDHASGHEIAGTALALPDDKTLNAGWLYRDGKLGRLVRAIKRSARGPNGIAKRIDLEFTDEHGRRVQAFGSPIAATTMNMWGNLVLGLSLIRWECDGQVAFGDCQDGLWSDQLLALNK